MSDSTTDTIPFGYCECGCGQKTTIAGVTSRTRGWIKGNPVRFIRGHANKGKCFSPKPAPVECACGCGELANPPHRYVAGHHRRKSPVEYIVDHSTGCWEWQRAKTFGGYGVIRVDGRLVRAHRRNYEATYGTLPTGVQLHHRCFNPGCVNPDHLVPVTNAENTRLGVRAKLTTESVAVIKSRRANGESVIELARAYGVHKTTIQTALNGVAWSKP